MICESVFYLYVYHTQNQWKPQVMKYTETKLIIIQRDQLKIMLKILKKSQSKPAALIN